MLNTIKKTFKASVYQQAIFDQVEHGSRSLIVEAVAGSGKSTTIKQAVLRIPEHKFVHIFAFNAHIAREMKEGIEELGKETGRDMSRVRVSTFHSVGWSAILRRLNKKHTELSPDSNKMRKILKEMFLAEATQTNRPDYETIAENLYDMYGSFCARLVGLAKGAGFGAIVPAGELDWFETIKHHDLTLDSEEADEATAVGYARAALRRSNELAREGKLDYDDQLYIPLLWKLKLWQNDWVFIDEAQDTNVVRRALAKLALRPGGRLVAVGDRHQAIYGFTGASHDALDLIKKEFNCLELPLSVSYRCAKSVVALAKTIVPHIEHHDSAPEGAILRLPLKEALDRLENTDVIMCRNTAPLVELAFKLVAAGRGCNVMGKEIGSNLISLIRQMKAKGIPNLLQKLHVYQEREVAKHMAAGNEGKAEAIMDRVACIQTIVDNLSETHRTQPMLIAKIEGMFSDQPGTNLSLGTLHKLKGAEFNRAALYEPALCPSKWARQDWQVQQEYNLLYVGYTRAKLEFIFIEG